MLNQNLILMLIITNHTLIKSLITLMYNDNLIPEGRWGGGPEVFVSPVDGWRIT